MGQHWEGHHLAQKDHERKNGQLATHDIWAPYCSLPHFCQIPRGSRAAKVKTGRDLRSFFLGHVAARKISRRVSPGPQAYDPGYPAIPGQNHRLPRSRQAEVSDRGFFSFSFTFVTLAGPCSLFFFLVRPRPPPPIFKQNSYHCWGSPIPKVESSI